MERSPAYFRKKKHDPPEKGKRERKAKTRLDTLQSGKFQILKRATTRLLFRREKQREASPKRDSGAPAVSEGRKGGRNRRRKRESQIFSNQKKKKKKKEERFTSHRKGKGGHGPPGKPRPARGGGSREGEKEKKGVASITERGCPSASPFREPGGSLLRAGKRDARGGLLVVLPLLNKKKECLREGPFWQAVLLMGKRNPPLGKEKKEGMSQAALSKAKKKERGLIGKGGGGREGGRRPATRSFSGRWGEGVDSLDQGRGGGGKRPSLLQKLGRDLLSGGGEKKKKKKKKKKTWAGGRGGGGGGGKGGKGVRIATASVKEPIPPMKKGKKKKKGGVGGGREEEEKRRDREG